ncbi:MAG: hypothetical protein QXX87_05925 [Candidatus Jordarchaeales archaeon]
MERTKGITFFSLAYCAFGALLVAVSIWGLENLISWGLLQPLDAALLAMFLAVGLTFGVSAVALFQLKNWGRLIIIVFSSFMVLAGLVGIFVSPDQLSSRSTFIALLSQKFPYFNVVSGVAVIFLGLAAVWYLSKPRVKLLFWW